MNPIDIIGIGQGKQDLTKKHLDIIQNCDVLVGGGRQLAMFKDLKKEEICIKGDIGAIIQSIKERTDTRIVVLASGDPLFYGIGSTLTQYFDKEQLNIHSNISSVSAAFAAIKEPWHDAKLISFHGKQSKPFSFSKLINENKIAFLTDLKKDPHFIATGLIKESIYNFRLCVLEKLGTKDQKVTWFENPDLVAQQTFSQPNIVILKREKIMETKIPAKTHIGMDDSLFQHSNGLITKSEVRSITLSKLKLINKDHVLWDIGAGSGSISIEASLHIPQGHVYAMEKHPERVLDISYNIKKFNCTNVTVLNKAFPGGVEKLATPDRIFIGGGGSNLGQIIKISCDKLEPEGIIVINTVLLENLDTAIKVLKEYNFNPSVCQIQVSRSKEMPFGERLEALNPVWIIFGSKPELR